MAWDYDVLSIGLGPAGMAVSAMASEMGLKVAAVERRAIGGECMNVGCIPSKSLLTIARTRHAVEKFPAMELHNGHPPSIGKPFEKIRGYLKYINEAKTVKMFDKVDLHLQQGDASFIDSHTVEVAGKRLTAKRIFICTGTSPAAPPIPGLNEIDYLTNESMFDLDDLPSSIVIIGGGAIGCEMAQAFHRLGCSATIVHMDPHLVPVGDEAAARLLEDKLVAEGITVYNSRSITKVDRNAGGNVVVHTEQGEQLIGEKLLVAAGRRFNFEPLRLENAGVQYSNKGIGVDKYLRTNVKHVYACGDCNGHHLLSHAAMHQGMIALMNAMMPGPMKMNFRRFVVPWTVFTEPQFSQVGLTEQQLRDKGIAYETITVKYEDYGAAIAESVDTGFVKVFASTWGRIYGAVIIGEGSGEMINEWALAIQSGTRLHKLMMLQHSFPTMGFLSKRVAETWMMKRMQRSGAMRRMAQVMYRL
jgi:pyruvate/2-oxoglutarate dehydrogenase complex dihydrolipoamide dehydrogenase (E3) component